MYILTSFMFSFNTKFNENPITTAFVRGVFPQNTNFSDFSEHKKWLYCGDYRYSVDDKRLLLL